MLEIAAGSGITPIMSMIKNVLINEPLSSFTLIYGNKTKSSIMYLDEINLFKNYKDRFSLYNIYSQEKITILYLEEYLVSYSRIYLIKIQKFQMLIHFLFVVLGI